MARVQSDVAVDITGTDWVLSTDGATIVVPDAHLLFSGTYRHTGSDLIIEGDGKRAVLPDYFAHEHGPVLQSVEGARLDYDTVRSLSGHASPWQFAQAGGAAGPVDIGTVRTVTGTASVQRAGTTQPLASGDPVFQGDVVQTGAGSSMGIILKDNTVFSLSADARMVMSELIYDASRTDNAMSMNLVQGTFVFITGQVAKTGTLSISTPVATMGIRGTTPIVKLFTFDGSGEFSIAADPGPGAVVGSYTLTLPNGQQATVASTDIVVRISNAATIDFISKTFADQQTDQQIVAPAYQVHSLIGQRGDIQSPIQQANATAKGQSAGGFQYAFAVLDLNEMGSTPLLDNTVLQQRDGIGEGTTLFEDILRRVTVGGALGIDLDTTQPGANRQALFAENATALPVTNATQITLPPNVTQLQSATVVLQNQLPGDNLLVGALPPGITFTITFGSIHVNLSGVASAADYIAALQAIRFINISDNPSTEVRVIDVTVTAVDGEIATATTFVTIQPINDAPVNHLPAPQTAVEDSAHIFSAANGNAITVSDADAGTQPIITTLSVQHGTLAITAAAIAATGVSVSGNGTGTLVVTGSQASINAALDGLAYLANPDFHGTDALVVSTNDNGASGSGGALTTISVGLGLTVTEVNDAPQGASKTINTDEDHAVTLQVADFGFTDPNDTPANSLLAVKITTLPGNGLLTLDGHAVAAGSFVSATAIAAGQLVWTPGDDDHGSGLASLTFQVQDNGGTANGGVDLDPTARTLTFDVASVNDAPQGASKTINTDEDHAVTLQVADFGFTDPNDTPANSLLAVKITTLPGNGLLTLDGHAVAAGSFVSATAIAAGQLVWTPGDDDHGSGLASLTFQVQDNGGTANGGVDLAPTARTLTFDVASVNDAPHGTDKTITTSEDHAVTLQVADFGFTDPNDTPANSQLAVKITTLPGNGLLTLDGHAVAAGSFVSATAIAAGQLVWTPGDDDHGSGLASLTFQVQDNGGTANGGVDLDPTARTLTFDVASVNDAPHGTDKTITTSEDHAVTLQVADFGFTDPNDTPANSLLAVKITTLPGNGLLTLDGHAVAAGSFVSATAIAAGQLVWTPGDDDHGSGLASLTFQVQDNGGTAGGGVDLDPLARTLTFDVASVNDAPHGTSKTIVTDEDHAVTLHVTDFGFTDPNDTPANSLLAVKITTLPGSGLLTLDGHAVAAGSFVSATAIAAGQLVWTPGDDDHGNGLASLTFQVQDNGGTASGGVDLDPTARTLTFDVASVNDAPVNSVPNGTQSANGPHGTLTFTFDTEHSISVSDVDAGNLDLQVTLSVEHGTLKVTSTVPGLTVTDNGKASIVLTGSQTEINAALDGLVYRSSDDDDDEPHHDLLTITTNDLGNSGVGGALSDTDYIRINIDSDHSSSASLSFAAAITSTSQSTFYGVGSAVEIIDFATASFANTTKVVFNADAPLDPRYAVDILSHFDNAERQIDLSGILDSAVGHGAVTTSNVAEHVSAHADVAGKVSLTVDIDGPQGAAQPFQVASISGTAAHGDHALAAGDVIAVIFDQTQPAAHVTIQ